MNYCPNCGTQLVYNIVDGHNVKTCSECNYIDWDNWVNVSCVTVAYTNNNEIIMVRLKENNKITFPGGYRELGETLEQGATREFYEETGMTVKEVKLYRAYTKDEIRLVWIVFKGKVDEIKFTDNSEVSEIILVKNPSDVDVRDFRGPLTIDVFNSLFE